MDRRETRWAYREGISHQVDERLAFASNRPPPTHLSPFYSHSSSSSQKRFPILFQATIPLLRMEVSQVGLLRTRPRVDCAPRLIAARELAAPTTRDPACNPGPMQRGKCPNGAMLQARESFDVLPPRTVVVGMTLMQPDTTIDYAGLSGHLASHTFLFKFHLFSTK